MTYVVLARKWRPRLFRDVVGQEHVTKTLQNAISADRIAHAYLFCGPRGVGKTTVARIFAKAVNCNEGPQPEPCEKCKSCAEITSGRSIDVIEIDAASNRGIDEIRELREGVKFAPVSGRYKVYIIDEAHMITHDAFNAFLKTLEEPPEHVIFILATTEPHKIPDTILSRCQRFDFRMLTRRELIDRLREIAKAEKLPIDDEALSLITESADGGMRDAESILDQLVSFGSGEIRAEEVSRFLGLGEYRLLDQLVEDILQSDASGSLNTLNSLADRGADLSQCLKKLISHIRDLMVYKINAGVIDASETRLQQLAEQSEAASVDRLMKIARILTQAESDTKELGYERLNLELALVRLSRITEDSIPLDEVLGKLEVIESKLSSHPVGNATVVAESAPVYTEAEASVLEDEEESDEYEEADPLRSTWSNLLKAVKQKHTPALHAFLKEASPVSISDDSMEIDYEPKFAWHCEQIQEVKNRNAVETELSELMGKPMKLRIKGNNSSQDDDARGRVTKIDMLRDAREDESVKLVLDIFNGRVVEVKQ